jgi:PhoD-like phosphatase
MHHRTLLIAVALMAACDSILLAQAERAVSWNNYFREEVASAAEQTKSDLDAVTKENWESLRQTWRSELRLMLGIEPPPERTDLETTVTGTLHHAGLTIQRLHYQSRPGLYVTANLYLPQGEPPKDGWPAVLYVCGHAKVDSNGRLLGNKTAYHHHGLWFARHATACLIIDTVQLGELQGEHHGTYKLGRWDWISRGYTPAGVEAWNAIRGLDLLESWPGINSKQMGITGRSGGGAYSWFAAALDDRIRVVVPVAGITDLENHIVDNCVEGHCDCMYFVNYFGWDYPKLAALIAPRPLLLANSDHDTIFPLSGVMRTHDALAKLYRRLGATDQFGLLISPGPHLDTQELQVGAFKWLLKNLHGTDVIIDSPALKELTPNQLAVFDHETPKGDRVASVGQWFAANASRERTAHADAKALVSALSNTALRLPLRELKNAPQFSSVGSGQCAAGQWQLFQAPAAGGLPISVLAVRGENPDKAVVHVGHFTHSLALTINNASEQLESDASKALVANDAKATHYFIHSRTDASNFGATLKDRTQTIRRFYLLGQMPDQLVLSDLLCGLKFIRSTENFANRRNLCVTGQDRTAPIAALAGLICSSKIDAELPTVDKLIVTNYPKDDEVGPSIPGLLRETSFKELLAVAKKHFQVKENSSDLDWTSKGLVNSSDEPQQATGMRMVELGSDRVRVFVRATRWPLPNLADLPALEFEQPAKSGKQNRYPILPSSGVEGLQYAVPGVKAEARVGYKAANERQWKYTDWKVVDETSDYSSITSLDGLQSSTSYEIRTQVKRVGGDGPISSLTGSFRTLPKASEPLKQRFRLAVGTCQDFPDRDGPYGFDLYRTMISRNTDIFVMAGDVVYYDAMARTIPLANYHWQRTYGLPTLVNFHKQVPTYFLKDDHDTYVNDSWPGAKLEWTEEFTFEDGQEIFAYQTGLPSPAYRTINVSNDLQLWFMEGRDYRSPNNAPDGPEKSIWGETQKSWLKKTLAESTAKFKVLISPTPIVGPDRDNKKDNHSNVVFANEGQTIRKMLSGFPNLVTVCGDRHWQYHSIDPSTGLHEFSVGPASDRHAGGWNPKDFRKEFHQFLRVGGGYLEIEYEPTDGPTLTLRHFDTRGVEQHAHQLK